MKALGYLMLIGGFLGGAFATALDTQHTNWMLFWPAVAVAATLPLRRPPPPPRRLIVPNWAIR